MGQVLHGCARTTAAVRRAIQHSQKSLNGLAELYGINPKTVAKWKKRGFANDAPMGPKDVRSTVLTKEQEAAVVAFRKYTLLPLDDCLYALQPSIPHLTRSSLHRYFLPEGISARNVITLRSASMMIRLEQPWCSKGDQSAEQRMSLEQDRARHDLQAGRGRREKLASPRWPQPVAENNSRCKIHRRN